MAKKEKVVDLKPKAEKVTDEELKKLQDKAKHQSGIEIDKSGKLITN